MGLTRTRQKHAISKNFTIVSAHINIKNASSNIELGYENKISITNQITYRKMTPETVLQKFTKVRYPVYFVKDRI